MWIDGHIAVVGAGWLVVGIGFALIDRWFVDPHVKTAGLRTIGHVVPAVLLGIGLFAEATALGLAY